MSDLERLEVMVKAGVMTPEQAAKAKRRLAEIEAEKREPTDASSR